MSTDVQVKIRCLEHGSGLILPAYQSAQAAGMDLYAAIDEGSPLLIAPGARAMVPTGIAIELDGGYEAQVRPRSGLAAKHGVTVLNSPGTIDADYRGEIKVILINLGDEPFAIARGDRIAQLVVQPVSRVVWVEQDRLASSDRGDGGFGSSGQN